MLVDDEPLVLENLKYLMRDFPQVEIIYENTDSRQVLRDVSRWENADVAVMDINMPELSGIELSREIFRVNPSIRIIFLTAYEEYVLDAMESNIIDYILKPITVKRMQRTMDKLERVLSEERKRRAAAVRGEEGGDSRWFNAFRDNQYHRIDWKDGCYITVEGREIALYTKDGRYLLRHSLGDWEALLSENGWFRCHRAFLINPQHIKAVSTMVNSTMSIRMDGAAEEIPVSRSYSNEFRKRMGL